MFIHSLLISKDSELLSPWPKERLNSSDATDPVILVTSHASSFLHLLMYKMFSLALGFFCYCFIKV